MSTAYAIIKRAMNEAGILTAGESPSAQEAVDGLAVLNSIASLLSNDSLLITSRTLESFPLSGGVSNYTIGDGATFDTVRPINVISAYTRQTTDDMPISIISDEKYAEFVTDKSSLGRPIYLNYDNAYPLATIRLYPSPDTAYTLYILSEKAIASFAMHSEINMPDGWEEFLVLTLAVRLGPMYGQQASPYLLEMARDAKSILKKNVLKKRMFDNKKPLPHGNILSGYFK